MTFERSGDWSLLSAFENLCGKLVLEVWNQDRSPR